MNDTSYRTLKRTFKKLSLLCNYASGGAWYNSISMPAIQEEYNMAEMTEQKRRP